VSAMHISFMKGVFFSSGVRCGRVVWSGVVHVSHWYQHTRLVGFRHTLHLQFHSVKPVESSNITFIPLRSYHICHTMTCILNA
jgi:hypothetical protein